MCRTPLRKFARLSVLSYDIPQLFHSSSYACQNFPSGDIQGRLSFLPQIYGVFLVFLGI